MGILSWKWAEKRKRSRIEMRHDKQLFKKNRDCSGGKIRRLELGKATDVSGDPIMVRSVAGRSYRKGLKTSTITSRDIQGGPGRVLESEVPSISRSTQKGSLLLPKILHISDVLKLSEDAKNIIGFFLEYLDKKYNYEWRTNSSLQAFQISVCWFAVSFLKQEIDRKESLATVKVQLDFICEEAEANYIYSKFQNLDEGFKGYLKSVEPVDLEVGEIKTRADEVEVSERTACYKQDLQDREAQLSSYNSRKSKSLPSEQSGRYLKRCFESHLEEEVMSMSSSRGKRSKRSILVEQACEGEVPSSANQILSAQLMTSEGGVTPVGTSDWQYQEEGEILLDSNATNNSEMVTPEEDLEEGEIVEQECVGELPNGSAKQILSAQLMTSEGGVTPVGTSDWQYQEEGEILVDSNATNNSKMITPELQDLEEGEIVEQECEGELPNGSANQILSAQLMTSDGGVTPVGTRDWQYQEEEEILLDSNGTKNSKITPVLQDLEEGETPIGSEWHSLSDRVVNSEEGEKANSFQRAVTLEQELWSIMSGGSIKMKIDDVLHEKNLKTAAPRIVEKQLEASITLQLKKTLDKPFISLERIQLSDTELKVNNMLPTAAIEVHSDSDDAIQTFSSPTNQNHCVTLPTTPSAVPVISPYAKGLCNLISGAETIIVKSNTKCKTMEATITKEVTDSRRNQVGEVSSSTPGLELGFPPSVSVENQSPAESVHMAEVIIAGSNTDCDTMEATITKKVADSFSKKTGEVSSSTPDPELVFPPPVFVVKQNPTVNEYIAKTIIVGSNTECDTMEATITKTVVDSGSNKTCEVSGSTLGPEHCFAASVPVVTQSPVENVHIIESNMKHSDALQTQPNEMAFVDVANDQQAFIDEVGFIGNDIMPIQNKPMTSQRASISDHEPHSLECSVSCSSLVHQDMSAVQGESCPFQQLPISTVPLTAEQRLHVEPQFIGYQSGQRQSSSRETQIPRHVSFEDSIESRMPCTAQGSLQPVTSIREGGNETFVQNTSSRIHVQDFRNAANRVGSPNGHLFYSHVRPEIPEHTSLDPLQIEMQSIKKDAEKDDKAHQDLVLRLTSERDEEIRKVLQKYYPLIQGAETAKQERKKEHTANLSKVYAHNFLAQVMTMNVNRHMADLAKWTELMSHPSVYAPAIHGSPMMTCMPRNLQSGNELRAISPSPAPRVLQPAFRSHSSALPPPNQQPFINNLDT